MSDLVERLRNKPTLLTYEAAEEIERLRAIIGYLEDHADIPISVRRDARRALEPKP